MENMAADQCIVLTLEELNYYGQIAGKTAVEEYVSFQKEQRKSLADSRLRNIDLLLNNYRKFKDSVKNAVYSIKQIEAEIKEKQFLSMMLDKDHDDDVMLESVKASKAKTYLMVKHIDSMIDLYRKHAESSPDELELRRYNILYDRFISDEPYTVTEISEKYYLSIQTVYIDLKTAEKTLATLIFGVDSLTASN